MSRGGRWTVEAGRQLYFDGHPALGVTGNYAETGLPPTVADAATHLIADLFNSNNVTPDSLYGKHMGKPPRKSFHRTSEPRRAREVNSSRMDTFTRAYFEAALWSSTDESDDRGGEPLDKNYSVSDIAPETRDKMIADCADFQERFGDLYGDSGQSGHDFWLSRNGHGTGFFDRDTANADELQTAAKSYGEFNLYVGDDGLIYGS